MRLKKFAALAITAFSVVWGASSVRAAQIPWVHPSGTTADFDYNNGGTSDQLYVPPGTDPVVTFSPSGIAFTPSSFKAASAGGAATTPVSDKVSYDIHMHPGKQLSSLTYNEQGDYTISGDGPHTAVKVFSTMFLLNLDTAQVLSSSFTSTPAAIGVDPGVTSGQATWSASDTINNIPKGWTNIRLEMDNVLQASSDVGTSSFIEKKVVTPDVGISLIIPEPATLSLVLLSAGMLLSRRGRNAA